MLPIRIATALHNRTCHHLGHHTTPHPKRSHSNHSNAQVFPHSGFPHTSPSHTHALYTHTFHNHASHKPTHPHSSFPTPTLSTPTFSPSILSPHPPPEACPSRSLTRSGWTKGRTCRQKDSRRYSWGCAGRCHCRWTSPVSVTGAGGAGVTGQHQRRQ